MNIKKGNTVIYLSNNILRFDDKQKLKPTEGFYINGAIVEITLVKSRTNCSGLKTEMVIDFDSGFDDELSLFLMLKNNGKVNGAGAFLYIGDRSDMKFAQKNLKDKLAENEEFRMVFMQEAINVLKAIPTEVKSKASTTSIADQMLDMLMVA